MPQSAAIYTRLRPIQPFTAGIYRVEIVTRDFHAAKSSSSAKSDAAKSDAAKPATYCTILSIILSSAYYRPPGTTFAALSYFAVQGSDRLIRNTPTKLKKREHQSSTQSDLPISANTAVTGSGRVFTRPWRRPAPGPPRGTRKRRLGSRGPIPGPRRPNRSTRGCKYRPIPQEP